MVVRINFVLNLPTIPPPPLKKKQKEENFPLPFTVHNVATAWRFDLPTVPVSDKQAKTSFPLPCASRSRSPFFYSPLVFFYFAFRPPFSLCTGEPYATSFFFFFCRRRRRRLPFVTRHDFSSQPFRFAIVAPPWTCILYAGRLRLSLATVYKVSFMTIKFPRFESRRIKLYNSTKRVSRFIVAIIGVCKT